MAKKMLLFSRMIKYSPSVSCGINNVTVINTIVKTCSVKITTIASTFKDTRINKPPLPTDVFEFVNTPILFFTTTDIDDVERSNSLRLRDIARCSTLPYEKIPPSALLRDENSNNTYMSRDAEASCHLVAPFILNKHIHPFGIINHKYHYYICDPVTLFLGTISYNFQFDSSTEGSISKFLFETAHIASSSADVDALKFRLVQYDMARNRRLLQNVLWC